VGSQVQLQHCAMHADDVVLEDIVDDNDDVDKVELVSEAKDDSDNVDDLSLMTDHLLHFGIINRSK